MRNSGGSLICSLCHIAFRDISYHIATHNDLRRVLPFHVCSLATQTLLIQRPTLQHHTESIYIHIHTSILISATSSPPCSHTLLPNSPTRQLTAPKDSNPTPTPTLNLLHNLGSQGQISSFSYYHELPTNQVRDSAGVRSPTSPASLMRRPHKRQWRHLVRR